MLEQYLDIGKIVNTHGVKGELKVVPLTDDPERYLKLKWVYVDKKSGLEKYMVESVKFFKSFVILKLKEIEDMTQAEALRELFIKIDRKDAVKLPKNAFFISDILGCLVFDIEGKELGKLVDVLQTGSNDVYVVKRESAPDLLVPALKSVVREVDVENRRIVVELPEGLVEDEV